jgi:uncharacterized damage-inducible protein DinB
MTHGDVLELFAYNRWANERTLGSLTPLTDEQLSRPLGGSFPTILATAAHIAAAEWIWLSRWTGFSPDAMPEWAERPSLEPLRLKFVEIETSRSTFVNSLGEEDVARPLSFTLLNGSSDTQTLAILFQHVVNHGSYHRGQIASMLRQVGATAQATDLIRWARDRR